MSRKIVKGRVGDILISETIEDYNPAIPEQILTARKNICRKFMLLNINEEDVKFD